MLLIAVTAIVLSINTVKAQIMNPVKWSYAAKLGAGGVATIYLKADIEEGWHIYSLNQKEGGPQKTSFTFAKSADYVLVGKAMEPKATVKFEPAFDMNVHFFSNSVTFTQKIKLAKKTGVVKGKVGFMVCNESQCLPPDEVEFSIPVK